MRHLQSFKYVQAIADSGSIRGAAEHLAISPSALNRHIQSLELDLGIPLFDRLTKGVRLSVEGELFYQYAQAQLVGFEKLQSQINDIKGLRTGMVRVGVSADLEQSFLHRQIAAYQNDHPHVSFALKVVQQNDLEAEITRNRIDVALFYQPVLTRNLQVLHSVETRIHAVLPKGAIMRNKAGMMLYELLDHSVVMPVARSELRAKIEGACEKLGITLQPVFECADPLPYLSASKSARIAFALPFVDDSEGYDLCGYKLVPIVSNELGTGYVSLVSSIQSHMPIAAQKFAEQLIHVFEQG